MSDTNPPQPPGGGYGSAPPPGGGYGGYGGPPAGGQPPPNHLVWAILSTIFCCLPLGVASIVFAAQVNGKYASGDVAGAQQSSEKARKFALWSTIAGVVVLVIYIILIAVGAASFQVNTSTSP
ncbi:CD225/dispanin family protein [Nocardioides marmoraquaticus]